MNHPSKLCILFFLSLALNVHGQVIQGRIVKENTREPMPYVNIGVIGTNTGTVSDENGDFKITVAGLASDAAIRFSMIGHKAQIFSLTDLRENMVVILQEEPLILNEIAVSATRQRTTQLGENTTSKNRLTGWGGYGVGAGGERGIMIDSKRFPLYPTNIGVFVARNAYDSVLLRLHIRYLDDDLPGAEILPENIFFTFKEKSGLATVDVSDYNLVIERPFVISFEWVKAWNACVGNVCALQFSVNRSQGILFMKEASEGVWKKVKRQSPGIFINCNY